MKRRPVGRMLFLYQRRAFPTGRLCIFYRFFYLPEVVRLR